MLYLLFLLGFSGPVDQSVSVVAERFVTPSRHQDNLDSIAIYHGKTRHLAIVTAKSSHRLLIYDAVTGETVGEVGGLGDGPGQFSRPNGVLVRGDLLFVVERDNHRVQVLRLPSLKSLGFVGTDQLTKPYGLDAYQLPNGNHRIYVTDDYDAPEGQPIPEDFYTKRVKMFEVAVATDSLKVVSTRAFGEKEGPGRLFKVETIIADVAHNRLYICDEKGPSVGIKRYDLEGNFTGKTLEADFYGEPEGVALYPVGKSGGYLVVTDQQPDVSLFHIFDRKDLKHLGTFRGKTTANTDGIVIDSSEMGAFDKGGFWAVHDDQALSGFNWNDIKKLLNLK